MRAFCRFVDGLSTVVGILAAWLIAPLVFAICFEVVSRYFFNAPTSWSYELGYLLTGAGWLLGLAFTQRRNAHIRIDIFYARFSPRRKALVDIVLHAVFVLPFLAWLCVVLDQRMMAAIASGELTGQSGWNPPIWPFRAVFFVSFVLLALQILADVLRHAALLLFPHEAAAPETR
jgi:TRAP-type mannitol/chloroaromatic compound transport system permease small subunit